MSVIKGSSRKGDSISGTETSEIKATNIIQRSRAGVKDPVDSELGDDIDGQ